MGDKKQLPKMDLKKLIGKCKELCHRKDRLLIMFLTGILFLVISVPFPDKTDKENRTAYSHKTSGNSTGNGSESSDTEAYAETCDGIIGSAGCRAGGGYDHHGFIFREDPWCRQ